MPRAAQCVWVTRPQPDAGPLCRLIEDDGWHTLCVPLIEIAPAADLAAVRAALQPPADVVIFISRNAVRSALMADPDAATRWQTACVVAIGDGTRDELRGAGLAPVCAARAGSEAVLELPELAPPRIAGRRVLIVRGPPGRQLLGTALTGRGAQVRHATVYLRRAVRPRSGDPAGLWKMQRPDVIVVTSNEGLENLYAMFDPGLHRALHDTPLAVISERVAQRARAFGHRGRITVAPAAGDHGLLDAVRHAAGVAP